MSAQNLFIISGPSGAGEDSIISGIAKTLPIERVITTSTRQMRDGESQGNPYYFISKEEFQTGIDNDNFAEYAKQYNDNYYGVTKTELERVMNSEKIGIWKLEYKGVKSAQKLFPGIVSIMVTVPDLETLNRRIRHRDPNVSEEYLAERMEYSREWMRHTDIYDHVIVNSNGKLNEAIAQVTQIIQS